MWTSTPTWTCACSPISASSPATPPPQITTRLDAPDMGDTLSRETPLVSREKPPADRGKLRNRDHQHRARSIAHELTLPSPPGPSCRRLPTTTSFPQGDREQMCVACGARRQRRIDTSGDTSANAVTSTRVAAISAYLEDAGISYELVEHRP